MTKHNKIIILWQLYLFGMVFHTLISLMPIFFGASVAIESATGVMPESIGWKLLVFLVLPMICITVSLFTNAKWHRLSNLVVAALFTLASLMHLINDGGSSIFQAILLSYVLVVTVLLTWVSYSRFRENSDE